MKKIFAIYIILLSYPVLSLEYQSDKKIPLKPIPPVEVNIELPSQLFDKNFTYSNQFTLHHSDHFNLLVTANVTQIESIEQNSITDNTLFPPIHLPLNDTSHQYGLIGSYSLTSQWQVSGGLIYSKPSVIMGDNLGNIDNIALIGTSYSF